MIKTASKTKRNLRSTQNVSEHGGMNLTQFITISQICPNPRTACVGRGVRFPVLTWIELRRNLVFKCKGNSVVGFKIARMTWRRSHFYHILHNSNHEMQISSSNHVISEACMLSGFTPPLYRTFHVSFQVHVWVFPSWFPCFSICTSSSWPLSRIRAVAIEQNNFAVVTANLAHRGTYKWTYRARSDVLIWFMPSNRGT